MSKTLQGIFYCDTGSCGGYSTALKLKSLPIWGMRDWYGGGGYVVHLRPETKAVLRHLKFLQENHWIDTYTRAVLLEFATYNSQINLFGLCVLIAEFAPGDDGAIHESTKMLFK
ncbi:Polycystic kidney disease protein 1-like 2 [Portunus trituberculatus]|uniref:Polycystic kidney disease protein 1-like 2 n=1 Tax=Portunus trituberculatus TaxID=210409 RepID=A0A5B7EME2_PORTR|nr:Polycystic kidney disease protein 1-like 2 [Portunus trituberculatus]